MKIGDDRCQCMKCGEYFGSTHAFDKHRHGPWEGHRCMNPSEIGMEKNAAGFWISARKPAELVK